MKIDEARKILEDGISDTSKLTDAVERFQYQALNGLIEGDVRSIELLSDLAIDLDYYEASPTLRAEDPSFYGKERAISEIKDTIARLDALPDRTKEERSKG